MNAIPLRKTVEVNQAPYTVVGFLGRGSYGAVSHIHRKLPSGRDQHLAVKEQRRDKGERELEMLIHLQDRHHPYIVRLYGFGPVEDNFLLAMEHARHGDLYSYVRKQEDGLDKKKARTFYRQALQGIHFLHSRRVAHMDIKPKNILVMSSNHCRITDFGVSAFMTEDGLCRPAGTRAYKPPENRSSARVVNGVWQDLWGAAVTYVFMVIAEVPWSSASLEVPEYRWFRQGILRFGCEGWYRFGEEERELLEHLLHHEPELRLVPVGYSDRPKESFAGLP
ncbi:hypothetical protein L596_018291 [Steinernema carpocapsae]|uniref:Protein kinase domain-containing protein n=1 Tax=Steinernema carpocapsae TaxID=34508 RepID=A0A4U5N4Z1_STECR|nr:hypothetical protein L596_018291 [Steinernema carpocapsae]